MKRLNLAEAKARLSQPVDQAARGRSVIIAKSGTPMVRLVPLDDRKPRKLRYGTLARVLGDEAVEAIEAPLPDDVLDSMSSRPLFPGKGK